MTMHLMSHAYDTVRRGRGKTAKITKRDHERLTREWQDYNRYAKQNHLQKVTFDEYVTSAFGRNKVQTRPTHQTFTELERRGGRRAALQYAQQLLSEGKITGQMIEAARKANAPAWMIAAMAPSLGALSSMGEDESGGI